MAFGWRKLLGLKVNDAPPFVDGPHAPPVGSRTYAVGDSIAGEYQVLDIFSGGMGLVYLVTHHNEDTPFGLTEELLTRRVVLWSLECFQDEWRVFVVVGDKVYKTHATREDVEYLILAGN